MTKSEPDDSQLPTPSPSDSPGAETNTSPTTSARLRRYALNLELYTDDGKLEELAVLISGEADHVERLEAENGRLRGIIVRVRDTMLGEE